MTMRTTRLLALSACLALLAGCAYRIEGRVVRSSYPGILVVDADDARVAGATGLPGASIGVMRDALTPARKRVGSTTAGPDGAFVLTVDAVGAGITDEEWLVSASRGGLQPVESSIRLPVAPSGKRLLIMMTPGAGGRGFPGSDDSSLDTADDIMREVDRYYPR